MPDPAPAKRRPVGAPQPELSPRCAEAVLAEAAPVYVELHCRTNFSFLEGASHPDELVQQAKLLGLPALAITDRNSLAGVVRAHVAAKECSLKLLIGAEVTPVDAPPVALLATDRAAYGRLCRLLTIGRRRAVKGECELSFDDVAQQAEGLLACVPCQSVLRGEVGGERFVRMDIPLSPASDAASGINVPAGERVGVRGLGHTMDSGCVVPPSSGLRPPSPPKGGRRKSSATHGHGRPPRAASSHLARYRELFRDRCYALAELHRGPDDQRLLLRMQQLARVAGVPLVAANDVHYHVRERQFLHDVLTAVRHGCAVAQLGERRFPNAERRLKSAVEMTELFAADPAAVTRTLEIADRCCFSLDELKYEYPVELCPPGETPHAYLQRLTWDGARRRYPRGIPDKVRRLLEHELALIAELRYEAYFLTVWDLVHFARGRGILCQGRGSAANSAVCFCLEVTSVDPDRIDLLFERFVSKERDEAPDIDIDFEHERREEVIQYVYEKYGRERAGLAATVITYRLRSAVRDVGKALGLSLDRVGVIAKSMERATGNETLPARLRGAGMNPNARISRQLLRLVETILGFPRHLSQHVGGMVLTNGPLCELVPIENAAMPGRTVIEWDKDDLDALGILKVDCLALGMLSAIRKCFALVAKHERRDLTLANIPPEDPAVYEMVSRADTIGVFQIESRAQMSMLPRLRPRCFYDLVIEVAIVRPGPIQGDMVHPYLRRRNGEEPVEFPDERIREVLQRTLGVPIFQEQAMRLAVVAAGFTPGEADQLRRAMGAWRRQGIIDQFQRKLLDGMTARGYSAEFAERLFNQIRGFGEYGFPESHAASFALLVYVSAWLKRHHPAAFVAALLNSQPMGFYAPAQLIADARNHGIEVRPVDVNHSDWDCTLEAVGERSRAAEKNEVLASREASAPGPGDECRPIRGLTPPGSPRDRFGETTNLSLAIDAPRDTPTPNPQLLTPNPPPPRLALRLGLRMVKGLSVTQAVVIVHKRQHAPFADFDDFVLRTGLTRAVLKRLAKADAFDSLGLDRRSALWQSLPDQQMLPLFAELPAEEPPVELPRLSLQEQVIADYRTAGLSLRGHPLQFVREWLTQRRVVPTAALARLPVDRRYKIAGLILLRQRPGTAKGITFMTIEDEFGTANLIVRQEVWERNRRVAAGAGAIIAHGRLQRVGEVIHLLVTRMEDLGQRLGEVETRSRDFQ